MSTEADFKDLQIRCKDCEQYFEHTAGAQKFFADRGLEQPKRCARCREARRRWKDEQKAREGGA
jgi:hypothetical protein